MLVTMSKKSFTVFLSFRLLLKNRLRRRDAAFQIG